MLENFCNFVMAAPEDGRIVDYCNMVTDLKVISLFYNNRIIYSAKVIAKYVFVVIYFLYIYETKI